MKRWLTLVVACWMLTAACGGSGNGGPGTPGTDVEPGDATTGETDVTPPEDVRLDGPAFNHL